MIFPAAHRYLQDAGTQPAAQKYLEMPLKFPYTPRHVADDFKMPPCDLVS